MNYIINKIASIISPDDFAMTGNHREGYCVHCDANRNEARSKAILIVETMREAPDINSVYDNYACDKLWRELNSKDVWNKWIDVILREDK